MYVYSWKHGGDASVCCGWLLPQTFNGQDALHVVHPTQSCWAVGNSLGLVSDMKNCKSHDSKTVKTVTLDLILIIIIRYGIAYEL